MKTTLTIVARIEAKADKVEQVKKALLALIEPTRSEDGCLRYDLHQDNENAEVFLFYEIWSSREQWQTHMNSDHLKAYTRAIEGAVESFVLNEMSKVSG